MATAGIHITERDTLEGRLVNKANAPHSFIAFHVSADIALYLPCGADGPSLARALAAELLRAADEQDALLASDVAEEVTR